MIGSDACHGRAMDVQVRGGKGAVHENVIDRDRGKTARVGAMGAARLDQGADVTHGTGEEPVGGGGAHAVEVTEQNGRGFVVERA